MSPAPLSPMFRGADAVGAVLGGTDPTVAAEVVAMAVGMAAVAAVTVLVVVEEAEEVVGTVVDMAAAAAGVVITVARLDTWLGIATREAAAAAVEAGMAEAAAAAEEAVTPAGSRGILQGTAQPVLAEPVVCTLMSQPDLFVVP